MSKSVFPAVIEPGMQERGDRQRRRADGQRLGAATLLEVAALLVSPENAATHQKVPAELNVSASSSAGIAVALGDSRMRPEVWTDVPQWLSLYTV